MDGAYARTISEYFEKSAEINAIKPAVSDENGVYTYEELKRLSDRIAGTLIDNNIPVESRIAIYMNRSKECVAVMLGILKAGCSYMFVDTGYPVDRVLYMINDSDSVAVITDNDEDIFPDNILKFKADGIFEQEYKDCPEIKARSEYGAYIIYTSGSTGAPKGLMIAHRNFIGLYEAWGKEHLRVTGSGASSGNIAVIAPFSFDMCVLMIYGTLFMGKHLFIIPNEVKSNGKNIVDYVIKNEIGVMDATPNYIRLMNDALSDSDVKIRDLKKVLCIGDVLGKSLVKKFLEYVGEDDLEVYNTYGPAECTVLMTWVSFNKNNIEEYETLPIGRLTDNSDIAIVDEDLNEVKKGDVGELIILGDCVGLGYISSHVKKPGPFGVIGTKSYRTGDLVKLGEDNLLYFIGRVDRQCKINGYRIELEEIEKRIEKYEGIKEARVVVQKENDGFSRLYAFYTGTQNGRVRQLLKQELPYYMIPQEFICINEFPISDNGKVDYKKMIADTKKDNGDLEVGLFVKHMIAEANHDKEDNIDFDLSFYDLGGDSIMLLSLVSYLADKYSLEVNISQLMNAVSVNEMIDYIRGLDKRENDRTEYSATEIRINESQRKIYDVYRKNKGEKNKSTDGLSLVYRIEFAQKPDIEIWENIINNELERNEVFHCRLEKRKNKLYLIKDEVFERLKIQRFENEDDLNRKIKEDLSDIDTVLSVYSSNENNLVLRFSHVFIDFVSTQYFMKDIVDEYNGKQAEERNDVIKYMMENADSEEGVEDYWKKTLSGLKRTVLPGDKNDTEHISVYRGVCHQSVYDLLVNTSVSRMESSFSIVLKSFIDTLKTRVNDEKLTIGCYFPGRNYINEKGTLGMFTNVLPLVFDSGKTFETVVQEAFCNQNISQSRLYQYVPFEAIYDGELFDICFNYQNDWMCMQGQNVIKKIDTVNYNPDITNRPFYFGVIEENGKMVWEVSYDAGRFSEEYVKEFIFEMENNLKCIIQRNMKEKAHLNPLKTLEKVPC